MQQALHEPLISCRPTSCRRIVAGPVPAALPSAEFQRLAADSMSAVSEEAQRGKLQRDVGVSQWLNGRLHHHHSLLCSAGSRQASALTQGHGDLLPSCNVVLRVRNSWQALKLHQYGCLHQLRGGVCSSHAATCTMHMCNVHCELGGRTLSEQADALTGLPTRSKSFLEGTSCGTIAVGCPYGFMTTFLRNLKPNLDSQLLVWLLRVRSDIVLHIQSLT